MKILNKLFAEVEIDGHHPDVQEFEVLDLKTGNYLRNILYANQTRGEIHRWLMTSENIYIIKENRLIVIVWKGSEELE